MTRPGGPALLLVALEPKTDVDRQNLDKGLRQIVEDDPSFSYIIDQQTGQIVIGGKDDQHLEMIIDRLKREFNVAATVGRPHVAYKETLTRAAAGEMKYAKHAGGRGQYAHVKIHLYPGERGSGYAFEDQTSGGPIPNEFITPIDVGIKEALTRGVLAGYPVTDVHVVLYDGTYHEVDSSEMAFKIAGSMAFQDAARKAAPVLLEPVMRVEVIVPPEFGGEVAKNLIARRGRIDGQQSAGDVCTILALVPLAKMFGYATDLISRTRGRGTYTHELDSYQPARIDPGTSDDDRTSQVRAPLTPIIGPRESAIGLPEPDPDSATD